MFKLIRDLFVGRSPKSTSDSGREIAVKVLLSKDRNLHGCLLVYREGQIALGPLSVIAAIDAKFATRAGNPAGNWQQSFGNIPTGRYQLLGLAAKDQVPLPTDEDTGPWPILVLRAIKGEAAQAHAAGRGDLLLHGGPNQPGLGTLRLSDADLWDLLDELQGAVSVIFEISEQPPQEGRKAIGPRHMSPTGAFPERRPAYVRCPLIGAGNNINDKDPMDRSLLTYLIGWPTSPTPGSPRIAMLHGLSSHALEPAEQLSQAAEVQSADGPRDIGTATVSARDIYEAAFAVLRCSNPTQEQHLYGDAYEIFGSYDPRKWKPAEVEALCNLNGVLACGVENFLEIATTNHQSRLDHELAWLIPRLERLALPQSILDLEPWQRLCMLVAKRPLGHLLVGS